MVAPFFTCAKTMKMGFQAKEKTNKSDDDVDDVDDADDIFVKTFT